MSLLARRLFIRTWNLKDFPNIRLYSYILPTLRSKNIPNFIGVAQIKFLSSNNFQYVKYYSSNISEGKECKEPKKKLSLFKRFKQMYRDYWYVLVPVHVITSTVWFGGFYYMAKSGIDIVGLLELMHVSEKFTNPLRDSSMGYVAIAYALYKIATPVRYTITLGGTTLSINYLKKWGYIKPVPTTERIKEIYQEKKNNLTKSMKETKEGIIEKKDNIMESLHGTKEGIKETKDQIVESVKETKKSFNKHQKDINENISRIKNKTKVS